MGISSLNLDKICAAYEAGKLHVEMARQHAFVIVDSLEDIEALNRYLIENGGPSFASAPAIYNSWIYKLSDKCTPIMNENYKPGICVSIRSRDIGWAHHRYYEQQGMSGFHYSVLNPNMTLPSFDDLF